MNYNIFSPKGKIDRCTFVIYYIILMSIYLIIGFLVFPRLLKSYTNLIIPNTIFIIINLLILFNYKKRFMEAFNNLALSLIFGTILTFDHLFIPFILKSNAHESLFFIAIIFAFCVQPAIAIMFPPKKAK